MLRCPAFLPFQRKRIQGACCALAEIKGKYTPAVYPIKLIFVEICDNIITKIYQMFLLSWKMSG